jgi:hypothetical protein
VINGKGEAREEGNDDATFPRGALAMCADDPIYQRIANPVLNIDIIHDGPARTNQQAVVA